MRYFLVLTALLGGCDGTPADSNAELPTEPKPSLSTHSARVEVWFTEGETLVRDIATVQAANDTRPAIALAAINEVLTPTDIPSGHDSAIPSLAGPAYEVTEKDGVLTIGLFEEFLTAGGSLSFKLSLSLKMRTAQIVYTGTQFEGVDAVKLKIDGKPLDFIRAESIDTSGRLVRNDFADLAPPTP